MPSRLDVFDLNSPPEVTAVPEVLCKDYREFLGGLAAGSVDLVLTDPPYAISRDTGFSKVRNGVERFAVSMDFGEWDHAEIDLAALAELSFTVLRPGGTIVVWYDLWKLTNLREALVNAGFKMLRMIIWQKTNPVPLNSRATYLSNSREMAVVGVKGGKPTFNSEYDIGVYQYPIPRGPRNVRYHPTQKPLSLFRELIRKHSKKGDLVLDPFAGCGTTALACLAESRHFQGCDINPDYTRISNCRIEKVQKLGHFIFPRKSEYRDLFLELAQPDKEGFSREVPITEFVGEYQKLSMGNGCGWGRDDGPLGRYFDVHREKEGNRVNGRVISVQLNGLKEKAKFDGVYYTD